MQALKNRIFGRHASFALGLKGEVDHHNRILFHNADQQHYADDRDDVEIFLEKSSTRALLQRFAEGKVEMMVSGWTRLS